MSLNAFMALVNRSMLVNNISSVYKTKNKFNFLGSNVNALVHNILTKFM